MADTNASLTVPPAAAPAFFRSVSWHSNVRNLHAVRVPPLTESGRVSDCGENTRAADLAYLAAFNGLTVAWANVAPTLPATEGMFLTTRERPEEVALSGVNVALSCAHSGNGPGRLSRRRPIMRPNSCVAAPPSINT